MLWYGDYNKTYVNIISRKQNKLNRKSLQLSRCLPNSVQINKQTFRLYKPNDWSLVITSPKGSYKKVVTMYSPVYVLQLPIPSGILDTRYDSNTNTLSIHNLYVNHNYRLF